MKRTNLTANRFRKTYALFFLVVFTIGLPLGAFTHDCCCAATVAVSVQAPASGSSCHKTDAAQQPEPASCHTLPTSIGVDAANAENCCSSPDTTGEKTVRFPELSVCKTDCATTDVLLTDAASLPTTGPKQQAPEQTQNLVDFTGGSQQYRSVPRLDFISTAPCIPLFILNGSFLI